jgi:hypothetical protein
MIRIKNVDRDGKQLHEIELRQQAALGRLLNAASY